MNNSCQKKYLHKNLDEIFNQQIENAISSFPEIKFSRNSNELRQNNQESCFILVFNEFISVKNFNFFSNDESEYIDEFLKSEKFEEVSAFEIKSVKAKINGIFSNIFCLKLKDKENYEEENSEENKIGHNIEACFKKLSVRIKKMQIKNAKIIFEQIVNKDLILRSLTGLVLNNFYFTLKNIENKKTELSKIEHIGVFSDKNIENEISELKSITEATFLTKVFSNAPANIINPESWAKILSERFSGIQNLKIKIVSEDEMIKLGMHSLVGVGLGSKSESKLVILEYIGAPEKKDDQFVFIGKGITFDTGGLSLKPGDYMEGMKYDKSGAASVFGALMAVSKRKAKINLIGLMPLAENAVSENSQRPDDVVVSMSGQTIDIRNTDAEGRLILADALTYAQRFYKPKLIIDLATLTGAMAVALGSNLYAGLFSNNDILSNKITEAGEKTTERVWRMPLNQEYNKKMDSKVADMQNTSNTRGFGGGSITAAEFLQRFIENKTPWAHLDIANVDNLASDNEQSFYGSCGFGVRLLNEFIKNYES